MIALIISIILNAYLGVAFSVFNRYKIDLFQTIVFNYWACVITGVLVLGYFPIHAANVQQPWFAMAILMGVLFISVFNLIAISSIKVGVTITQTANKLSLIIPVMVSFIAYHESITALKIIGILVALLAVFLTTQRKEEKGNRSSLNWTYFLPILLFLGSGIIDTLTKFVQQKFITNEAMKNSYLIAGFFIAAIIGSLALLYSFLARKREFQIRSVFAGIILGVPNYFSIYYLVQALENKQLSSTAIIPINNIGVLFLVSLFGIGVLKEKLSRWNYLGLALTLLAILLIFIGDS